MSRSAHTKKNSSENNNEKEKHMVANFNLGHNFKAYGN